MDCFVMPRLQIGFSLVLWFEMKAGAKVREECQKVLKLRLSKYTEHYIA